jgi:hypothetical protein
LSHSLEEDSGLYLFIYLLYFYNWLKLS